jgi:hypothetical protein
MIKTPEGLEQTRKLLRSMEEVVAHLMRSADQMHPTQLALLLEGPVDMIRRLRAEIDEYLGIRRAEELLSVHQ